MIFDIWLHILSLSAVASTCYNSKLVYLAVTHGSPQEVWQNDLFGVGTSVRALELDRLIALLLRVFSRSATITRPSLSYIEANTDLFTLLGAPGEYTGNIFSLGAATRLRVSDFKL